MVSTNQIPIFDSHCHIINHAFPIFENDGFFPKSFLCEDYLSRLHGYKLLGGAIVSGSFQKFDQTYLLDSLGKLGEGYVGVIQIPVSISDREILGLHEKGIRAVRFNLKRGGSATLQGMERLALRVHSLVGWHSELYIESTLLAECMPSLLRMPTVSIDHLGLKKEGLQNIYRLAERGAHIKATGFGRVDFKVEEVMKKIYSINPEALMFGTDLPSTRTDNPYQDSHYLKILELFNFGEAENILFRNAQAFYLE